MRLFARLLLMLCSLGVTSMSHAAPPPPPTAPALAGIDAALRRGDYAGMHAVLVVQHGQVLLEWYGHGRDETIGRPLGEVQFGPDTLHDIRSVTKSVVSLLYGIARDEGIAPGLDAPVLDAFPECAALRTPERLRIRVRDVLSMTSGLHWDEWTRPYTDPLNSEIAMDLAPDPYRYVLEQPIDAPPGSRWAYSGGDVALVGGIVARGAHMPLEVYARQKLFDPLGIRFEWSTNHSAIGDTARAASGLRMTPRDLAKLGQLMLANGVWQGRQVVPAAWVALATQPHIDVRGDDVPGNAYGYLWWLRHDVPNPWFGGIGNGGQRLFVVPGQDLVVVTTAGLYNSPTQGRAPHALLVEISKALAR